MKISYKDFINKICWAENQGLPFVVFRYPNEKEIHLFYQDDTTLHLLTNWEEKGFVIHSFTGDKSFVLQADNYFKSEVELVDDTFYTDDTFYDFSLDKQIYINLVEKGIKSIQNNDFQKVVLSQKITIRTLVKTLSFYFEKLINTYKSAFCYVFFHPKIGKWMAATPEILLKIKQDHLETMSLAGTQKVEDNKIPFWKEKEKQEQQIVTDSIVENLQTWVSELSISPTKTIQAGNLWHLCTEISAKILNHNSINQIVKSLHPTPAVCGFPTEKARDFILTNENYNREFYTGFCGVLNFPLQGELSTFVNLRCMQVAGNELNIYIGGGITKDSNPEMEWKEIQNKAQTMLKIVFS